MITLASAEREFSFPAGATPFVEVALVALCRTVRRRLPAISDCGRVAFALDVQDLPGMWVLTIRAAADELSAPGNVIFGPEPIQVYAAPC